MRYKPDDATESQRPLSNVQRGVYVKRKLGAAKVYQRGAYDPGTRRYELIDCDDISRSIWLRGSTVVWVGFTY
jgi:hypothetical protein